MSPSSQAIRIAERATAAILAATARLVARRGLEATTLEQISHDSGASAGAIVRRFGGKVGATREICRSHMSRLLAAVEQADRPDETRRRRLDAMALAMVEAIAEAPAFHTTMLLAPDRLSRAERRDLRQQQKWLAAPFLEALEAVVPALRERPDLSKPAVMSLLVLLNQHATWFHDSGPMPRATYPRFAVTAILSAVRQELRASPS